MPHPWSCGWLSGPGAARAQPPPPGEPLPAESGGICGRVPQLQRGPERRGEQSGAGGGWERGGWEAFFLHLPFFFFFFLHPKGSRESHQAASPNVRGDFCQTRML